MPTITYTPGMILHGSPAQTDGSDQTRRLYMTVQRYVPSYALDNQTTPVGSYRPPSFIPLTFFARGWKKQQIPLALIDHRVLSSTLFIGNRTITFPALAAQPYQGANAGPSAAHDPSAYEPARLGIGYLARLAPVEYQGQLDQTGTMSVFQELATDIILALIWRGKVERDNTPGQEDQTDSFYPYVFPGTPVPCEHILNAFIKQCKFVTPHIDQKYLAGKICDAEESGDKETMEALIELQASLSFLPQMGDRLAMLRDQDRNAFYQICADKSAVWFILRIYLACQYLGMVMVEV